MNKKYFSVYDKVAERFNPPFLFNSDLEAIRVFRDCIRDPQHVFAKNPNDYDLYQLGEWDPISGQLTCDEIEVIITGAQLYAEINPEFKKNLEERKNAISNAT